MITVYSKNDCTYCIKAKEYLTKLNVPFNEINTSEDETARHFIKEVEGHKTLPQIYKDGKLFIEGGYSGLIFEDPQILMS